MNTDMKDPITSAMVPLRWTKKAPVEAGAYWLRYSDQKFPGKVVNVVSVDGVLKEEGWPMGHRVFERAEWAGPIPWPIEW